MLNERRPPRPRGGGWSTRTIREQPNLAGFELDRARHPRFLPVMKISSSPFLRILPSNRPSSPLLSFQIFISKLIETRWIFPISNCVTTRIKRNTCNINSVSNLENRGDSINSPSKYFVRDHYFFPPHGNSLIKSGNEGGEKNQGWRERGNGDSRFVSIPEEKRNRT